MKKSANKFFSKNLIDSIEYAKDGIISKTLLDTPLLKYILFSFEKNQRLSKHSAPFAAGILVLDGKGKFTLGSKTKIGVRGSFFHMPSGLPHAVFAQEKLVFFLIMAKSLKK